VFHFCDIQILAGLMIMEPVFYRGICAGRLPGIQSKEKEEVVSLLLKSLK